MSWVGCLEEGMDTYSQALILPLTLMVLVLRKVPLSLFSQLAVCIFLGGSNFLTVMEVQKPLILKHF